MNSTIFSSETELSLLRARKHAVIQELMIRMNSGAGRIQGRDQLRPASAIASSRFMLASTRAVVIKAPSTSGFFKFPGRGEDESIIITVCQGIVAFYTIKYIRGSSGYLQPFSANVSVFPAGSTVVDCAQLNGVTYFLIRLLNHTKVLIKGRFSRTGFDATSQVEVQVHSGVTSVVAAAGIYPSSAELLRGSLGSTPANWLEMYNGMSTRPPLDAMNGVCAMVGPTPLSSRCFLFGEHGTMHSTVTESRSSLHSNICVFMQQHKAQSLQVCP